MGTIVRGWVRASAGPLALAVALIVGSACNEKQAPVPAASSAAAPARKAPAHAAAPPVPLSPEEEAAKKLLEKYAGVDSCLDRAAVITHADDNKKALAEFYKKKTDCKKKLEKIDVSECKTPDEDGYCFPTLTWVGKSTESHYCVVKTPAGPTIDWRCSVTYNPVALVTFTAVHTPGDSGLFRLHARLSDVFKADFAQDGKTHYSLTLRDRDGKVVQGYVPRTSPDGQKIFDDLKDGKEHALFLEIGYPKTSTDPTVVEVRRLVGLGHRERPEEYAAGGHPATAATAIPAAPAH
jgi:hypothetical protein